MASSNRQGRHARSTIGLVPSSSPGFSVRAIFSLAPSSRAMVRADSSVGQKVRIAIRPERLRMGPVHGPGLPARIRDIVYRGPVTHYYMDSAGGPLLCCQQNAGAEDWFVGAEVRCSWDAESAVVLDGGPA